MRYLIDGYNLMHAMGLVRKGGGETAWLSARRKLLDWLADQLSNRQDSFQVVFDAQHSRGALETNQHRGVKTLLARGQTADDVIEELVAEEHLPNQLTVVSNDHRLRDAAYRSQCFWITCEAFSDILLKPQITAKRIAVEAKPITQDQIADAELLRIFNEVKKPTNRTD